MVEFGYQALLAVCLGAGLFALLLAALKRDPSWWSVGSIALVEVSLIVQLVCSIVLVAQGASAVGDTVEYFGYVVTAMLIPPASVLWAIYERTKWSTLVIAVAGFTVAIMAVRMWQIWSGNAYHF